METGEQVELMTFHELVDAATQSIFDGLIQGGTAIMRGRISACLSQAIMWRQDQDKNSRPKTKKKGKVNH